MYKKYLKALSEPGQQVNPLFSWMGIEPLEIVPGRAVLRMEFQDGFIQGGGAVAGGIIATLLDEALAHAVVPTLENGTRCVTVDLSVRYLSGVRPGETLTAKADVIKRGRRMVFVEARAEKADGKLAAKADGVFAVVPTGE